MIQVTILKNQDGQYLGFDCKGHAGYADRGKDIVCAGVSTLVINTVNAVERLTKEKAAVDASEEDGWIALRFHQPARHDAQLLMDALVLGLEGILQGYGTEYMAVSFQEV